MRAGLARLAITACALLGCAAMAQTGSSPEQMFQAAEHYRTGQGAIMDLDHAAALYQQAAAQGSQKAADALAVMNFETGRIDTGLEAIEPAARRGNARALYLLGSAHLHGDGGPRNPVLGYAELKRAAAAGDADAANLFASIQGDFSEEDRRKADQLYGKSLPAVAQAARPVVREAKAEPVERDAEPVKREPPAPKPRPVAATPATPKPKSAPAPKQTRTAAGWKVQLGSFQTEARAKTRWKMLLPKVAELRGMNHSIVEANGHWRLKAGDLPDKAAASAVCRKAVAAGADCLEFAP